MSQWLRVPEDIQAFNGLIDDHIQHGIVSQPPRGYATYHPSAFGKCLRQMKYLEYAEAGHIPMPVPSAESRMARIWALGHDVQSRWERYFTDLGILRGVWECVSPHCMKFSDEGDFYADQKIKTNNAGKLFRRRFGEDDLQGCFKPEKCACGSTEFSYHEVSVKDKDMNLFGHADCILDFSRLDESQLEGVKRTFNMDNLPKGVVVADLKTCNLNNYRNKVQKKGPDLGYQIQLTIYANLLDCEYGILIYECKNDCALKTFHIPRNEDTWWLLLRKQAALMMNMTPKKRLPPPRPFSMEDYDCKYYCEFKDICKKSGIWECPDLKEKRKKFYGNLLEPDPNPKAK